MIADEELLQRVELALDTIRPHLRVDGGNVEIVDVTDAHVLRVRWSLQSAETAGELNHKRNILCY